MGQVCKYTIEVHIPEHSLHEALMAIHTIKGVVYVTHKELTDDQPRKDSTSNNQSA